MCANVGSQRGQIDKNLLRHVLVDGMSEGESGTRIQCPVTTRSDFKKTLLWCRCVTGYTKIMVSHLSLYISK